MAQHFLLSTKARTLSLAKVMRLTDEEAYETFQAIRWADNDGKPYCPKCGSLKVYTFAKRSAPYAMFNTFDAPTGEACVARREMSNTPLQALTLLNDAVFIETAQALGATLAGRAGSVASCACAVFVTNSASAVRAMNRNRCMVCLVRTGTQQAAGQRWALHPEDATTTVRQR